jgi:hypothetical protein
MAGWLPLFVPQPAWEQIPLGPGGFISGLSFHADGTKFARTDTSGALRWNSATSRWVPCVTANSFNGDVGSIPDSDTIQQYGANPGVYELVVAPSDSSRVYMMWGQNSEGRVWLSSDRGNTFTKTTRAADAWDPNDFFRGASKKLAVDPQNKDVVICGALNGVSYTADAGANWSTISTGQIPAATTSGRYLFAFDPSSTVASGKTQRIYCFSWGNGLYRSNDGGTTWTAITSGPTDGYGLVVSSVGKVFLVRSPDGDPADLNIYTMAAGGSSMSTVSTGTYGVNGQLVQGIAVDPNDPTHVIAMSEKGNLSYSSDSGATFSGYGTHFINFGSITWLQGLYGGTGDFDLYGSPIEFDPTLTNNTVHIGHGLGTAKGVAPTSNTLMTWTDNSIGIEQLCARRLLKPGANLILAVLDQGVFGVDGTTYPDTKGILPYFCAGRDADYCPTDPLTVVAMLAHSPVSGAPVDQSGISRDGGETWTAFPDYTEYNALGGYGGMIACGTDRDNFIISITDVGAGARQFSYTTDGGVNWSPSTFPVDVPTSGDTGFISDALYHRHTICGDRVAAGTFYARNGFTEKFYRSTDGGANWSERSAPVGVSTFAHSRLISVPGQSGHLFYMSGFTSFMEAGPAAIRSTDGGANWSTVHASVGEVVCMGFGKALSGGYPTIYFAGWYAGHYGIYRSTDNAVSWTQIGDFPRGCFDTPIDITGDLSVYGSCYIACGASGIFHYRG